MQNAPESSRTPHEATGPASISSDLVLLDADPLRDIRNTTKIRAVVAHGRYFDRAALDQLLGDVERGAAGNGE